MLLTVTFSTVISVNADPDDGVIEGADSREYWALLVGTDPKAYCSNDANIMYDMLIDNGWDSSHISKITGTQTTKSRFREELNWLDDKEDRNDVVIFYFSGHGGNRCIAFYDYGTDSYNMVAYYLVSLKSFFNKIESKNFVLIFDTCMAGSLSGDKHRLARSNSLQTISESSIETKDDDGLLFGDLRQHGRVIITSCKKNEYAYGDDDFKNGIFTHYYVEGLSGGGDDDDCNGRISIQEGFSYAKRKTEYYTSHHSDPDVTTMHPGMDDKVNYGFGELEITLPDKNKNDKSRAIENFAIFQKRVLILLEKVRALLG